MCNPFCYFTSSPEATRLTVMMYIQYHRHYGRVPCPSAGSIFDLRAGFYDGGAMVERRLVAIIAGSDQPSAASGVGSNADIGGPPRTQLLCDASTVWRDLLA